VRPEQLGLREKKPKKERPARLVQLERPVPPAQPERLVQMDETAGRVLIALSGLGDPKRGREWNLPLFYFFTSRVCELLTHCV
jgi:hypothetical protein